MALEEDAYAELDGQIKGWDTNADAIANARFMLSENTGHAPGFTYEDSPAVAQIRSCIPVPAANFRTGGPAWCSGSFSMARIEPSSAVWAQGLNRVADQPESACVAPPIKPPTNEPILV